MSPLVSKRALIAAASVLALALIGVAAALRAQPAGAAVSRADSRSDTRDSAAQVALGKQLFNDPTLSRDGQVSCASCHQAERAFTDGKPVSTGFEGKPGLRNAMSLLNVGNQPSFFWDGRRARLEDQVLDPLVNPLEHALADQRQVLAAVGANPASVKAFQLAYPGAPTTALTTDHLAQALAAFVRTLASPESAIDRFVLRKDNAALSADARAGFAVFTGKAQCTSCHSLQPDKTSGRILLTDQDFHAHSATFYGMHQSLDQAARLILSAGQPLADAARFDPRGTDSLGRFMVTGKLADVGAFRTPGLRNVARTAPYFHDGRVATLELALEQELLGQGSEPIPLTPQEKRVLLAFLRALDDDK